MRYAIREYHEKTVDLCGLEKLIIDFFKEERFKTQSTKISKGILIQARKGGIYRPVLSTDKAFTLIVEGNSTDFKIKIGIGKWMNNIESEVLDTFQLNSNKGFIETPEALWAYEIEHHLWHFIENQIELGIV